MAECSLHQQQGYILSLPLYFSISLDFRMDESSGLELILGVVGPQLLAAAVVHPSSPQQDSSAPKAGLSSDFPLQITKGTAVG